MTPDEAYNFGYSFGQIGQGLNGATGDPAIDQAITNGATDALEVDLERLHSRQTAEELR